MNSFLDTLELVVLVKSLEHLDVGNCMVSHAQNKFPILQTISNFKSAATMLALCLVFQVQADTPVSYTHLTLPTNREV